MSDDYPLAPGFHYGIPADDYHADKLTPDPALSSSIAMLIGGRTPAHAFVESPRLNPDFIPPKKGSFDLGSACHDYVLEGLDRVSVIKAPDWRKDAAKAARERAYKEGRLPLLVQDYARVKEMATAFEQQAMVHPVLKDIMPLSAHGKPEVTGIALAHGVTCRVRYDWQKGDPDAPGPDFIDYKTTTDASSAVWSGRAAWARPVFQDSFYAMVWRAIVNGAAGVDAGHMEDVDDETGQVVGEFFDGDPTRLFVVQEVKPPYALNVFGVGPRARALAYKTVKRSLYLWRRCLEAGQWPGYPTTVTYIEPSWGAADKVSQDEQLDELAGGDPFSLMLGAGDSQG